MDNLELAKKYADAIKAANEALHHLGNARSILGGVSGTLDSDLFGIAEAIMRAQRTMADSLRYINETAERHLLKIVTAILKENRGIAGCLKRQLAEAADSDEVREYLFLQSINPSVEE